MNILSTENIDKVTAYNTVLSNLPVTYRTFLYDGESSTTVLIALNRTLIFKLTDACYREWINLEERSQIIIRAFTALDGFVKLPLEELYEDDIQLEFMKRGYAGEWTTEEVTEFYKTPMEAMRLLEDDEIELIPALVEY